QRARFGLAGETGHVLQPRVDQPAEILDVRFLARGAGDRVGATADRKGDVAHASSEPISRSSSASAAPASLRRVSYLRASVGSGGDPAGARAAASIRHAAASIRASAREMRSPSMGAAFTLNSLV